MGTAHFYSLFGTDQLQADRVDELLLWWPNHKKQPTDKAVDIAISNLLISYLTYPSVTNPASVQLALEANFVLAADAYNQAVNGKDTWDDTVNNNVLFQYQTALSAGESSVTKLLRSPSIRTILANFGEQPSTTGEPDLKLPLMWNAYILLSSLLQSFYKNAELDRLELKTIEPGWSEASLQNLAENKAVYDLFHPKRKTLARAINDASEYFPFCSLLCGTLMTIRAIKYSHLNLKDCSTELEVSLDDIRQNIPKILISAAWIEKQFMSVWLEPTINIKAKKGGKIVETKKIKSQSFTKLMANKGYVSIMPLSEFDKFKLPYDGISPPEFFLKDFAFVNATKNVNGRDVPIVSVGRRSTTSRPKAV